MIKKIMYGKEHPRIHYLGFLNIDIPIPNKVIQEKIIFEIEKKWLIEKSKKKAFVHLNSKINDILISYLT